MHASRPIPVTSGFGIRSLLILTTAFVANVGPVAAATTPAPAAATNVRLAFRVGAPASSGVIALDPAVTYSRERGYGFEPGNPPVEIATPNNAGSSASTAALVATAPFHFSVHVPEGNYRVTVTLGNPVAAAVTTVKAETRRLMLENIATKAGEFVTQTFIVNVRGPKLADGREVDLDSREMNLTTREPIARHWDDKLTVSFSGAPAAVAGISIEAANDLPTLFLTGDSTVTDQPAGGSWGQYVTRWFKPEIAVANHAESGETLKGFLKERRWQKLLESIKPGDFVLIEFGTNDSKSSGPQNIYPGRDFSETFAPAETTYQELLRRCVNEARSRGAQAIIASPSARREETQDPTSLAPWAHAAMAVAKELDVPAIDLNAMGVALNRALGEEGVKQFADRTHHTEYGAYLQAKCIALGLRQAKAPVARFLRDDFAFDPAHPSPLPRELTLPVDPRPAPRSAK